ncbi:uncharacterized protein LOC111296090 [Durio zibethinus]|uniref:Uncharacterized protein LOC111296090 n=1 Tax=Durio zibethinus TaxID=66656 RepID=A0A6P5Z048_DURZI|nr:uncharacterized protein LOC111296090 [Durio zibethinus]XP_022745880.1 uncharacterized protein LOC111296090 [Durio zibethinus]
MIEQDIYRSSSYYIALGNLNSGDVKCQVELNLTIRAFIYDTTEAYYKCTFTDGLCNLSILFHQGNSVVLTSFGPEQMTGLSDCHMDQDGLHILLALVEFFLLVTLITTFTNIPSLNTIFLLKGGMSAVMLVAINCLIKFQYSREDETSVSYRSTRAPLLSSKDDDISSWGSSYDSVSSDEADLEDSLAVSVEGTSTRNGENSNNTQRLYAICFDAPRECFFLPCGHCAACYACGTRIAGAFGTCPICRQNMKKVGKIFTV